MDKILIEGLDRNTIEIHEDGTVRTLLKDDDGSLIETTINVVGYTRLRPKFKFVFDAIKTVMRND